MSICSKCSAKIFSLKIVKTDSTTMKISMSCISIGVLMSDLSQIELMFKWPEICWWWLNCRHFTTDATLTSSESNWLVQLPLIRDFCPLELIMLLRTFLLFKSTSLMEPTLYKNIRIHDKIALASIMVRLKFKYKLPLCKYSDEVLL